MHLEAMRLVPSKEERAKSNSLSCTHQEVETSTCRHASIGLATRRLVPQGTHRSNPRSMWWRAWPGLASFLVATMPPVVGKPTVCFYSGTSCKRPSRWSYEQGHLSSRVWRLRIVLAILAGIRTPASTPPTASATRPTAAAARTALGVVLVAAFARRGSHKRKVDVDGLVQELGLVGAVNGRARLREGRVFDQCVALW